MSKNPIIVEVTPSMLYWSLNYVANRGYCEALADAVEDNPDYDGPETSGLEDMACGHHPCKDLPVYRIVVTERLAKKHARHPDHNGAYISPLNFPELQSAVMELL